MTKVLFVIPTLEYGGSATEVSLLATSLARKGFEVQIGALAAHGPAASSLQAPGVPVFPLGPTRLCNLATLWRLRRLLREFEPEVVHTWGAASLKATLLTLGRWAGRLLASLPFSGRGLAASPSWLDRLLLRRVDQFLARGNAEAQRWAKFGVSAAKIAILRPSVLSAAGVEQSAEAQGGPRPEGLPAGVWRWISCVGPLERHKGFLEAIWSFDMLQFLYADLKLLVIGAGPDRDRLEHFARTNGAGKQVHFVGPLKEVSPLIAGSEVVWVPSQAEVGYHVALEAMARARPVVASRVPGLSEIVVDGETGYLVTPGDKVELARQTRVLLDDPSARRRMGEAGRTRVAEQFSASQRAEHWTKLLLKQAA